MLKSFFADVSFGGLVLLAAVMLAGCDSSTPATDSTKKPTQQQTTKPNPTSGNPSPTPVSPVPVAAPGVRSIVVLWNEAMLAAIRNSSPRPTVVTRAQFMVHSAIYDAWSVYDATAVPTVFNIARQSTTKRTQANKEAAVSQAAYHMLINLFATYEKDTQAFSNLLKALGYAPAVMGDSTTPAGIGFEAAHAVLMDRENDGANAASNFADVTSAQYPTLYAPVNSANPANTNVPGGSTFDPNRWQPLRVPTGTVVDVNGVPVVDNNDATSYRDQIFLTPHWGAVRPFALTSGDQFRPTAPPQAGSNEPYTDAVGKLTTNNAAYQEQLEDVLSISANLSDQYKVIAEYWADGPRSETPPGHWNALAHGISERDGNTLDDDVKMYFALNAAVFDAGIAVWEAKRAHDFVRPVSAIRHKYAGKQINAWGGPNLGRVTMDGLLWRPYQSPSFVTPAFAEFVSGHSGFSAAAAEVLTRFTGSNTFYDGKTLLSDDYNKDGIPDLLGQHVATIGSLMFETGPTTIITLRWNTFQEAADEAGVSRRYGGIHFQDGDLHGRIMGKKIAEQAFLKAESYWKGAPQ